MVPSASAITAGAPRFFLSQRVRKAALPAVTRWPALPAKAGSQVSPRPALLPALAALAYFSRTLRANATA